MRRGDAQRAAHWVFVIAATAGLAGCALPSSKGDSLFDPDGDGISWPEDCDSSNPDISPVATDSTQDGVDQNCDGVDGTDSDRDGVASLATGGRDCDDADPQVAPGAAEQPYDGVDNDCDAATPDDDLDGDGATREADCEDGDPSIAPGAAEVCGDGVVNDCLGTTAAAYAACAGERSLSEADGQVSGETAEVELGSAVSITGDLNGDGRDDLLMGGYGAGAGLAVLFYGPVSGEQGTLAADAIFSGETDGDDAGFAVTSGDDLNGDGIDDLAVGAPLLQRDGLVPGGAYVVFGPITGDFPLSDADAILIGLASGDNTGSCVSMVGDVDGDRFHDLLVSSRYDDTTASNAGAVYLMGGPVTGTPLLSTATATLLGEGEFDYAGWSADGLGDVDGDGLGDLLIGAFRHDSAATDSGAIYLVTGAVTGAVSLGDAAHATLRGRTEGDGVGYSLAIVGDADGDGLADLLVGAPQEDALAPDAGAVYLVLGTLSGVGLLDEHAVAALFGEVESQTLGLEVSGAGDVDGDGLGDLLLGNRESYGDGSGAALVVPGGVRGAVAISEVSAATLAGEAAGDRAGGAVSGGGDTNGDGFDDVLVGAYGVDTRALDGGAAYLILGGGY